MTRFLYALKSKEAKRQYPRRFKVFLDYLKLDGPINQQALDFLLSTKRKPQYVEERFMDFVGFQLERVSRGEIVESTIRNYLLKDWMDFRASYDEKVTDESYGRLPISHTVPRATTTA